MSNLDTMTQLLKIHLKNSSYANIDPLMAYLFDLSELAADRGEESFIIKSVVKLGRVDKAHRGDSRDAVRCDSKLIFLVEISCGPRAFDG